MKCETQILTADRANQIYERFKERSSKDDEYTDWAGYREELTDFIVQCTRPGGSLLILGAGKCNDLDLRKLAEHCGSITLSDYRKETVEEAFRRYGLAPSEKLGASIADYVGITDEDYLEYTERLLGVMEKLGEEAAGPGLEETAGSGLEDIAGPELVRLRQTLDRIYRDNEAYRIDLGDKTYDNAVVVGVHSQLNNSFRGLFQYVHKDVRERLGELRFAEELNDAVFQMTREHTGDLVLRFNDAVFASAREGIIYGYEKWIIYTPNGASEPVIGTVDGARQAGELIADFPIEQRLGCLWPLSKRRGVKFEMDICYLPVDGWDFS